MRRLLSEVGVSDIPQEGDGVSQIETHAHIQRVLLLGASNLSMSFPSVVETSREMFAGPSEIFAALGFGRSFGQESKFFRKKFLGILQCNLWTHLDRAERMSTVAIVSDIGNDLAYGTPVDRLLGWLEDLLDRLEAHGARTAISDIPIDSLRAVGAARYRVMRWLLFPRCTLSRCEMMQRAERLSAGLHRLAESRKTAVFPAEIDWYGLDPIHPRRAWSMEIWRRMIASLSACDDELQPPVPPRRLVRKLRALQAKWYSLHSHRPSANEVRGELSDGTTIALF